MGKINVEVSEKIYKRLKAFKKVAEEVLREPLTFDDYSDLVISIGLENMVKDILMPLDVETLLVTLEQMFKDNPEFISDFMANTMKRGKEVKEEEVKKTKEKWHRYIG